jgi:hypothetical protein
MAVAAQNYRPLITALQQAAAAQRDAIKLGQPAAPFAPAAWNGDPLDIENLGEAFHRRDLYDAFRRAVGSAAADATIGDLMTILLQGDFLAAAERAFRSRHAGYVRSATHAAARQQGHAHADGLLANVLTNYVKQLASLATK